MIVMQHLKPDMYKDYTLRVKDANTGKDIDIPLDESKRYTAANLLKNRRGSKHLFLLETDLNANTWIQQNGFLIPKPKNDKNLMW